MQIIKSPLGWRIITALILIIASCCFLSEAIAKTRRTSTSTRISATKVSPGTPTSPAAAMPASGTLDATNRSLTYTDGPTVPNPTGVLGAPICDVPNSCSDFTLTVNASSLAATHYLRWDVSWLVANVDIDIFIEKPNGDLVANNNSTTDPSTIIIPIPPDGTVYHLVCSASVGTSILTGTASLVPKPTPVNQGVGAPARYINYPAPTGVIEQDNEASIGVDWNPNVELLVDVSGQTRKNTGGVVLFTNVDNEYRVDFDDCSSPAGNPWQDTASPILTGLDPIGFVDHFSTEELGLGPNPPHTPGRVFHLELAAGNSTAAISDDDGVSWTPLTAGNYPAGPDHETLGGGPFHAPVITPPPPAYPNAVYYCSQNGVQNAECSASYDGGVTYGPGVPMFPPTLCGGGIHGHLKVSPQGTVYVPNSSCAEGPTMGTNGLAVSKDNGITWNEFNVPNSTGSEDPAVAIGQNNVGKPVGQVPNTVYFGWVSADGHAHAAHSPDEGTTWQDDTDVSSILGVEKCVFAAMVAGDDNRAAFAFVGVDPAYAPAQVWHLYIANTYDRGQSWILVDVTPNDPVQVGNICLLGLGCDGARNLLDFNGIDVDREGRVVFGYTDGCKNCANTRTSQSGDHKPTIARQSGGRRLFAAFDPIEPAVPAAPQMVSAARIAGPPAGVQLTWREPDNGGSPITAYNIYRGQTSGSEVFLATVTGNTTTKYLDQTADPSSNAFYRVTAVNDQGQSAYCRELNVNGIQPSESACVYPYLTVQTDADGDQTGGPSVNTQENLQKVAVGEPFISCGNKSITFLEKVQTLTPVIPPGGAWMVNFTALDATNTPRTVYVQMDTQTSGTPTFNYGFVDSTTGQKVNQCGKINGPTTCPVTGSNLSDGTIVITLDRSAPLQFFGATNAGSTPDFTLNLTIGSVLTNINGQTQLGALPNVDTTTTGIGSYTLAGNLTCHESFPVAKFTATPMSGTAPLGVNFDASTSTKSDCAASVASYTLDFGDGSPPVTQGSPLFSHTYNSPGDYQAKLTVIDSTGLNSVGPAQLIIHVTSTQVPLVGAASRKTHGTLGDFDLNLPLTGTPAVECRSGGINNDYQLIFVFPEAVNSVASVDVTGVGSVHDRAIGTDPHQYIVNLTGVTTGHTITVTLIGVQDAAGHAGNVSVSMGVLVGDINADHFVDASDIGETKSQSGHAVTTSNYREDLNTDGFIDSSDIGLVKSKSGNSLP
ncbi:MAG TPA: PKD domain-containing protein [Chthoniobacterales bacterium]|nr:PKD domain-containing protein [Chthoniobacterales bacterium]